GFFRLDRARLAPPRRRLERGRDVGELLHALPDGGDVGGRFRAERGRKSGQARLVPVDAVGADDVVENPALLGPAPHRGRVRARGAVRVRAGDLPHIMPKKVVPAPWRLYYASL